MINFLIDFLSEILILIGVLFILLGSIFIFKFRSNDAMILLHISGQCGFGVLVVILGISINYPVVLIGLFLIFVLISVSSMLIGKYIYKNRKDLL